MFFPYWLSVILVSLALYGLWHFGRDLFALTLPRRGRPVTASLLVITRNAEDVVEGQVRDLLQQIAMDPLWEDIVVVDHGSEDLTPAILARLASTCDLLKIIHLPAAARPLQEGLAFCQGKVVYVFDLVNRLDDADWGEAVKTLLRR